ncbi:MAG: response regulator [Candidatus Aminicenantes bacterium]|nr:response regulator [Candidatus Aminicenantes bacterium]
MTRKILAIDDSPTLRKLLRYYLSRRGYEVSEANNGKAGLDFIMRENFDLVILDMEMPVMKGDAVLHKLKEMGNFSVPVLILSADKDEENKAKAIELGASFYLTKPFKPDEVVSRIENIFVEKEKKNKPQ